MAHGMRYLKEQPFRDRRGKPIKGVTFTKAGTEEEVSGENIMLGDVLFSFAENYVPTQKVQLTNGEIRHLWEAQDAIASGPSKDGYFVFENAPFDVLRKTVEALVSAAAQFARHAPIVEDALNGVVTRTIEEGPPGE